MTQPYDPGRFRSLADSEKAAIAPELAYRAGVLFRLVQAGMVRQPENEGERPLAVELAELFPEHYAIGQ